MMKKSLITFVLAFAFATSPNLAQVRQGMISRPNSACGTNSGPQAASPGSIPTGGSATTTDGTGSVTNTGATPDSAQAGRRLEFLTNALGLNKAQQAQVKTILNNDDLAAQPLIEQLKQPYADMESAVKSGASDNDFYSLASDISSISDQILAIDAKTASGIYALLTPGQQQKLDQLPQSFLRPAVPLLPPILVTPTSSAQNRPGY